MGVAKVEYYGRTLIDLTGDSVNSDVLAEGETAHDANGDLIVGRGVLNKGNFANAIVGNISGEMVAMDDVSPLEHKIPVKVRSKNVIPFPYNDIDKTTYGITFNVNADGSIVLNGTSTDLASFNLYHPNQNIRIPFETGVSYRIGATGERKADVSLIVYYEDETGANKWATDIFTWQNNFVLKLIYIQVNGAGKTFDNYTAYPIIAEGTTVPTFSPCIADDEVITVRRCGANVFDINGNYTVSDPGYASLIKVENDWLISMHVGGGASSWVTFEREYPAGTYTFCLDKEGTDTTSGIANEYRIFTNVKSNIGKYSSFYQGWQIPASKGTPITFTTTEPFKVSIIFMGADGSQLAYYNIMLNKGAPVAYEPYMDEEITTTLAKGAEFTSIAPNMTIYTDKEGVVVECSYNKDTNIVIEKLTQAIIALGGNV